MRNEHANAAGIITAAETARKRVSGLPQSIEINFPSRKATGILTDIPNFHWVNIGDTSVPVADNGGRRVCLDGEQIHMVFGKLSPYHVGQSMEAAYSDWRQMGDIFRSGHQGLPPSDPNQKLFELHKNIAPGGIWEATLNVLKPLIAIYAPVEDKKARHTMSIRNTIKKMTAQFDPSRAADYDLPRAAMIAGSLLAGERYIEQLGRRFDPQLFVGVDVMGAIFTTDPGKAFLDVMDMGEYGLNVPLPFFSDIFKATNRASDLIHLHKHIASIPQPRREQMANSLLDGRNRSYLQRILSSMILARTSSSNPAIAMQEQALATFHVDGKKYPSIGTELFTTSHLNHTDLYGKCIGDLQMWRERFVSKGNVMPPAGSIAQRFRPHNSYRNHEHFDPTTITPVHGSGEYGIALQTWREDMHGIGLAPSDVAGDWILPISVEDGIIKVDEPRFMPFDSATILPEVKLSENGKPRLPQSAAELLGAALRYLEDGTVDKWKQMFAGGVYRYQDPNGGPNPHQELQQAQIPLMVMMQATRDSK